MLITLAMVFSTPANTAQISDPDLSQKNTIDQMHHKLHDDQASAKTKEAQVFNRTHNDIERRKF